MRDKLVTVANLLNDLAAEYVEKVAPRSWVTDGWKELLGRLSDYDEENLSFHDETDPTELVHHLFLRLQDAEGRGKNSKKTFVYSNFNWGAREVDVPAQQARELVQPFIGRPVAHDDALEFLNALDDVEPEQDEDQL